MKPHALLIPPDVTYLIFLGFFQLKEARSLLIAGAMDYDEFFPALRTLEPSFLTSIKDLRSQVVREACMSAA